MKLLLDQGLPRSTTAYLRQAGIAASHVGDLGMATATDAEIMTAADERGEVVVTLDSDFHALLAQGLSTSPTVIRIRIEGLKGEQVANVIAKVIETAKDEIHRGAAISVTSSAIRVRVLPFGDVSSRKD